LPSASQLHLIYNLSVSGEDSGGYDFKTPDEWRAFFLQKETAAEQLRHDNPDLALMLIRKRAGALGQDPREILKKFCLPEPTTGFRSQIRPDSQTNIDPSLVKNGEIYLLRGDYSGLSSRGIYPYSFVRWLMTLDQFLEADKNSDLRDHYYFRPQTKLEQYMWQHSLGGCEPFVSATPNFDIARKHPNYEENSGSVYVIKMPLDRVILNYASIVEHKGKEAEYLISDYILPDQILAEIDPKDKYDLDPRKFIPQ
jgi:hypothetical protein